jgi:hypothetical protein
MPHESAWTWIEKLSSHIPVPFYFFSIALGIIIYLIFYLFSIKVGKFFPWDYYSNIIALAMGLTVAYQLAGVNYLMKDIKKTFQGLDRLFEGSGDGFYHRLGMRFKSSISYYFLTGLVVIPFLATEAWRIWIGEEYPYMLWDMNHWTISLDVFNYLVHYFMLYMLAYILWMILNLSLSLKEIGDSSFAYPIKMGMFSIDRVNRLRPLSDLTLKISVYYFVCVTLIMISCINPTTFTPYEIVFLTVLLAVGFAFFIISLKSIRKILNKRIEYELNEINRKREELFGNLMIVASDGSYKGKKDEIECMSTMLDTLHNEKDRIMQANRKGYDLAVIGTFITSSLLPMITLLEKLQLMSPIQQAINNMIHTRPF